MNAVATVAYFESDHAGFIDPQGHVTQSLPTFAPDGTKLVPLYRSVVLARLFDAKVVAMQRTQ
jgi:2-oxoisovalerate dehydrogenase E1 component alpha subunit